jgi:ketosteroid isomerase-like protein
VGKRSRRQLSVIPEQGRGMWDLGVCRVLGRQITIIGRTTMTTDADKTAIRAVVTAIHKGLRDGDAAAVTAHYVSDAMVFDLAPPLSHTVDRAAVAAWLGTWKGPVERQARELGITVSGDLALWHGYFRTTATTTAGDHAVWWERATLAFRREPGSWRVVHEHTSVPFYMDGSFRAAVDLEP